MDEMIEFNKRAWVRTGYVKGTLDGVPCDLLTIESLDGDVTLTVRLSSGEEKIISGNFVKSIVKPEGLDSFKIALQSPVAMTFDIKDGKSPNMNHVWDFMKQWEKAVKDHPFCS